MSPEATAPRAGARRLGTAADAPWKAVLEARRLMALPWVATRFALSGAKLGAGARVYGAPILQRHRGSTIWIGPRASLRSWPSSNPLAPSHRAVLSTRARGAEIVIGADFGMTGGSIVAARSVRIGDRVLLGADSIITDTDFHPIDPAHRAADINAGASAPVVIEDDVFVGMGAMVLKGVRLGAGSVIGAGSVVARDVPARAIVAGNPARVVRTLG